MFCKAETDCVLHMIKGTERKKCFTNKQAICSQWNIGHQYNLSY